MAEKNITTINQWCR